MKNSVMNTTSQKYFRSGSVRFDQLYIRANRWDQIGLGDLVVGTGSDKMAQQIVCGNFP